MKDDLLAKLLRDYAAIAPRHDDHWIVIPAILYEDLARFAIEQDVWSKQGLRLHTRRPILTRTP